jgi:CubicO group peptidase (beta-lactamase class C family)
MCWLAFSGRLLKRTGVVMKLFAASLCAVTLGLIWASSMLDRNQAFAQTAVAEQGAKPRFRADGPNADAFGQREGYPICKADINETRCRVGAFSRFDTLFPSRIIAASGQPTRLDRSAAEPVVRYSFDGLDLTLDDYLDRRPVTGLLIARGNTILAERYQYGRNDRDRLTSFSMAKSVVALLIGIAIQEGQIRSIDDLAEIYVPGLRNTEYGRTPIKALLLMSSGIAFSEDYGNTSSDIHALARLTLEQDPGGGLAAVKQFNARYANPGTRFSYSSADTLVLGLVLAGATKRTVSDYAAEKLWQPLGAEADATWAIDASGQEVTFAFVNAALRDWARLGLMLANRGSWFGKTVVPKTWLNASAANAIATETPLAKYGYQIWYSADRMRFSLRGIQGQYILIDPALKLVLVQTALSGNERDSSELFALWKALRAQVR